MYQSLMLFVLSFSLLHNIQGFAPQGCLYKNRRALCDFQEWIPPVDINEFGPEPLYFFGLRNINGSIPAGVRFLSIVKFVEVFPVIFRALKVKLYLKSAYNLANFPN